MLGRAARKERGLVTLEYGLLVMIALQGYDETHYPTAQGQLHLAEATLDLVLPYSNYGQSKQQPILV